MDQDRHIWRLWLQGLHRWGFAGVTAWLIEAAGPLVILGAQAVYLGQPFLNFLMPREHLDALARLLEEPDKAHSFATFLREDYSA